jgi:Spx/MgsR family transcriptional regulator
MPGATKRTARPKRIKFLHKPTCSTCRKARALLENKGVALELRDLGKEQLTVLELDQLIGDRDYRRFLNPRNELYRRRKMGRKPPTRAEALRLMAAEPNLIRRPVVIRGGRVVLGFDEAALAELAGR